MENEKNRYEAAALHLVEELTATKVETVKILYGGVMTITVEVSSILGETYIVRFYPENRVKISKFEPHLVRSVFEAGGKVAMVISDSSEGPSSILSYMVYKKLEGITLKERYDRFGNKLASNFFYDLINTLIIIKDLKTKPSIMPPNKISNTSKCWSNIFTEQLLFETNHAKLPSNCAYTIKKRIMSITDKLSPHYFATERVMNWGDINFENIIVNYEGELVGLIDFEGACYADFLITLGFTHCFYSDHLFLGGLTKYWPDVLDNTCWIRIYSYSLYRFLRLSRHIGLPTSSILKKPVLPIDKCIGLYPAIEELEYLLS